HKLQYRKDDQTRLLPRDPEGCAGLARAMGMDPPASEAALSDHRAFVAQTFRDAFRIAGMADGDVAGGASASRAEAPCADLAAHIQQNIGERPDTIDRKSVV